MRISISKKEKISEQILAFLYNIFPKPVFTSIIASELARDEEFTLSLLEDLQKKGLVIMINKNAKGIKYIRRKRWKLSDFVYNSYKNYQSY